MQRESGSGSTTALDPEVGAGAQGWRSAQRLQQRQEEEEGWAEERALGGGPVSSGATTLAAVLMSHDVAAYLCGHLHDTFGHR